MFELFLFRVAARRRPRHHEDDKHGLRLGRRSAWDPITLTSRPRTRRRRLDPVQLHRLRGTTDVPRVQRRWSTTMGELGDDPTHGCGRALWENNGANGQYGTTMALMLLPHWTDGCIAVDGGPVLRGVGHHAVPLPHGGGDGEQSSNPVRELRYVNNDAAVGVPYMQTSASSTSWSAPTRPRRRPTPRTTSS